MSIDASNAVGQFCEIWAEVLGTDVGPDDDYFALGGDSLAAVEIQVAVEERMGMTVEFRDFFEAPTPRQLAGLARAGL